MQNSALGNVDVGSVWVLPPTLTVQYHFMPHSAFSPYIGAGINVSFFYATQPANPPVTHWSMSNNVGAAIQAGFDYNFTGHWFANFDVKQIFLNSTAKVDALGTTLTAKTALNPIGHRSGHRLPLLIAAGAAGRPVSVGPPNGFPRLPVSPQPDFAGQDDARRGASS